MFNLEQFINQYVIKRPASMFYPDIEANRDALSAKIAGKSVLVIGGAGSIGSSFVKALLPFKPASLVVVDTNENALAELTRDLRSTKGISKAEALKKGGKHYPVHYSVSDTSGEKPFEEFVTDTESADLNRFFSLGVIIDKPVPDKMKVEKLFVELNAAFNKPETTKEEVISIMEDYLPNFEHIETGKSLDSKM